MYRAHYLAIALVALVLTLPVRAETELLALRHADAAQVATALAGNLPAGAAIKVYRQQLILSGSRTDIEDMKRLIALMDTPTRQLLISVRSTQSVQQQRDHVSIHRSGQTPREARASWQTTETTLSLTRRSHAGAQSSDGTQSIRTAEGQDALIYLSDPVAVPLGHGRSAIYDAGTGLWVNARVSGDHVVASVRTRQQQAGTAHIATQLDTQISGAVGQWLPVGSVSESASSDSRTIGNRGRSEQASTSALLLKVELLGAP